VHAGHRKSRRAGFPSCFSMKQTPFTWRRHAINASHERTLIRAYAKEILKMPKTPPVPHVQKPEQYFKYKQCLIIRDDVKMSCGKKCAQVAHASIGAFDSADKTLRKAWQVEGQKKVVLKAKDERTLYELKVVAERSGISTSLIQDAGMTEIPPGTITALGLGPAKTEDLDKITGNLSLL